MPVQIHPTMKSRTGDIDRVVSFYDSGDPMSFYSHANVPLMMTIMAIRADDPDNNVFSILSPAGQFNCAVRRSLSGRDKNSMHQHNNFEFMYILKGHMYQIVEGKRYLYVSDSCCLLNRDTLHNEVYSTDYVCLFLSISVDLVNRLLNYGNPMIFSQEKDEADNLIFRFLRKNLEEKHTGSKDFLDFVPRISSEAQKKKVHALFEEMAKLFLSPGSGATFELLAMLRRLFNLLCDPEDYSAIHVKAKTSADPLLFARIDQLLEKHHGRISNHELANMLNYNGSYIGRVVKKNTGMSLYDYAMTFTMRAAAELLIHSKKSVAEVAETLSFSNRSHFYEKFEEYFHTTPARFRAEHSVEN